ncbi:unnamed protein product [Phytomonas sp. Hart1]|nr:unnamed protein product [Phytomonas sp. Hart1]|eukprot:CCW68421.1 unnamed protein product [Phytomonas sp. isolate Hart1]
MLRHIRMTCSTGTELLPARLSQKLCEWVQPLYAFTVQHRVPRPGDPYPICRCRYPLYTLCYSHLSPYDKLPSSGGSHPLASSVFSLLSDAPTNTTVVLPMEKAPCTNVKSSTVGGNQGPERLADITGNMSPQLTVQNRHRPSLRKIWRKRMASIMIHPNIIPNRPTCYRCDICDGFVNMKKYHEADRNEVTSESVTCGGSEDLEGIQICREATNSLIDSIASAVSSIVPKETLTKTLLNKSFQKVSLADAGATNEVTKRGNLDEEDKAIDREHDMRAVSTDIANTIMNDTDVAELRYLDPFLVEVLSSPSVVSLSRYFIREVQAQLKRFDLTYNSLIRGIKNTVDVSGSHAIAYEAWIRQKRQSSKMLLRGQPLSEAALGHFQTQVNRLDLSAYAVRFAVAAYGLPYELGYFNSPSDIVKLHASPHSRYACATSDEQIESMRRMLQGEEVDHHMEFARSRFSTRIGHPSYAIVLDHSKRRVVLTFRGLLTLSDITTCMMDGYKEVDLSQPEAVGCVSPEFGENVLCGQSADLIALEWKQSRKVSVDNRSGVSLKEITEAQCEGESLLTRIPLGFYRAAREAAHSVLPALRIIHTYYPNYQLIVTGHSFGGAVAVLFYLFYCFKPKAVSTPHAVSFTNVQTLTFGAPPLIEKKILRILNSHLVRERERVGSRLINFCYGKDLISRLHPRSIHKILTKQHSLLSTQCTRVEQVTGKKYTSRKSINRNCDSLDRMLPTFAVPGEFLNISDSFPHDCFEVEDNDTWRSQLIFLPESIFHHHPIHYMRGLNHMLTYCSMQLLKARDRFSKNSNTV